MGWFDHLKNIGPEITEARKDDLFDEGRDLLIREDKGFRGWEFSKGWGSVKRTKHTDPEKITHDMMQIRDAVHNLLKIHGLPKECQVELSLLGQIGAGCAGFLDIGTWEKSFIYLDKEIYENASPEEVTDVYCGIGLHECSHILHTRESYLRLESGDLEGERAIIEGLLEDERIEDKVREESPGYAPYIHALKRVLFEKKEFGTAILTWDELADSDKMMALVFAVLRCQHLIKPDHKNWYTMTGHKFYEELRNILPHMPRTEKDVEKMGQAIMDLLNKIREELKEQAPKSNTAVAKEMKKEMEANGDTPPSTSEMREEVKKRREKQKKADDQDKHYEQMKKKLEELMKEIKRALEQAASKEDISEDVKNRKGSRIDAADREAKSAEELKEKMKKGRDGRFSIIDLMGMMERMEKSTKPLDGDESRALVQAEDDRLEFGEPWKTPGYGAGERRTIVIHPKADGEAKERYIKVSRRVRGHVARMRSLFRLRLGTRNYIESELTEGTLHRKMLSRAPMTDRIFSRSYSRKDNGISLCLLLDESGSMGDADRDGDNAYTAIEVAVLIAEALKGVPGVELEVYSFTSCGAGHTDCFMKYLYGKRQKELASIGGYHHGYQNYDHVAIGEAGRMFIKNTTNENRMMLVMCDGAPAGADYGREPAFAAVRNEIKKLDRKGVMVMQVAIESFESEKMYKHFVQFLDLGDLINRMRRLITTIIKNATT